MTIIINAKDTDSVKKRLDEKLKSQSKKGNLTKHFGQLKRNLDGLDYQLTIRQNEN